MGKIYIEMREKLILKRQKLRVEKVGGKRYWEKRTFEMKDVNKRC